MYRGHLIGSEETFGSVGFESIFTNLEITSNGRPIKVHNDSIDISKSNSYNEPKISPGHVVFKSTLFICYIQ